MIKCPKKYSYRSSHTFTIISSIQTLKHHTIRSVPVYSTPHTPSLVSPHYTLCSPGTLNSKQDTPDQPETTSTSSDQHTTDPSYTDMRYHKLLTLRATHNSQAIGIQI